MAPWIQSEISLRTTSASPHKYASFCFICYKRKKHIEQPSDVLVSSVRRCAKSLSYKPACMALVSSLMFVLSVIASFSIQAQHYYGLEYPPGPSTDLSTVWTGSTNPQEGRFYSVGILITHPVSGNHSLTFLLASTALTHVTHTSSM
jgi:hypothetical protein